MSVGGRGLTTNLSSSGLKTTIGIPGTGLSYRTGSSGRSGRKTKIEKPQPEQPKKQAPPIRKAPEERPVETSKSDFGETVNSILAILQGIAAIFGLIAGVLNFIGLFVPKKMDDKEKPETPVIDVDGTTVSQPKSLDLPATPLADAGRYPQTDKECTRLATEKPENWEWRLVLQLMKLRFEILKKDWEDATWGRTPTRNVSGERQAFAWCDYMLSQFQEITTRLQNAYGNEELITKAFGPSGEPGHAEQIILWMNGVCGELGACVDWEMEIQTLRFYPDGAELMTAMTGWTSTLLNPFYELCSQMHQKLEMAGQSQQLDMSINLEAPQFERFNKLRSELVLAVWKPIDAGAEPIPGDSQPALPPILDQQI
jgi:hypothetical protein